jgi:hypothetical protein
MNAKYQPKKPYVKPAQESAKLMSEENTQTPVVENVSPAPEASEVGTSTAAAAVVEPAAETQEPVSAPAPSPVVTPVVKPVVVNTVVTSAAKPTTAAEASMVNVFQKMRESGTVFEKMTMASLDSYVDKMKPGLPIPADVGARNQFALWKLFESVIETAPEAEFKKLWSVILAFFNADKSGVFGERYVYRFADQWVWSIDELNSMQRILNLVINTKTPATRALDIKRISIAKTVEGFSEKAKERLNNYYQA